MTMRRKQIAGTKYDTKLDHALDVNQNALVDAITKPHVRIPETLGPTHKIVASYPAHDPGAQPVQARGRIVWNRAYTFQERGPSYLDGAPDPGRGGGY